MPRKKRKGSVWDYLEQTGVLANGSDADIVNAKQEYRKKYFTAYKRKQRESKFEFTVVLDKSNGEFDVINKAAKNHKQSVSSFLKEAAFAYLQNRFIVPDAYQLARMEQMLSTCLNEIKSVAERKEKFFFQREDKLGKLEDIIVTLQHNLNKALREPVLYFKHDSENKVA
ncbi:MAG TPA: hypothetical protein PKN75_15090 [Bacteroidia bacterium]|nr:hypothetical protein [Bacteroidia bacterium]HNU34911.1 hypothetical protein [Bacteroidia bacterium]